MLVERKDYTHLLYVRKYSISTNDYELYVYGVNTTDIYHTMGEMYFRSMEHIERIVFVELTPDNAQAKLDFWKSKGKKFLVWHDKYKTDAVPVVRCKDCIFKREKREFGDLKCIILGMPMRFDNFCSYGEKNDNTNTEV